MKSPRERKQIADTLNFYINTYMLKQGYPDSSGVRAKYLALEWDKEPEQSTLYSYFDIAMNTASRFRWDYSCFFIFSQKFSRISFRLEGNLPFSKCFSLFNLDFLKCIDICTDKLIKFCHNNWLNLENQL